MSDSLELRGFFEGFKRNPFASVLLKGLSCLQRAARLLRDCDATEVEVSALVQDVWLHKVEIKVLVKTSLWRKM